MVVSPSTPPMVAGPWNPFGDVSQNHWAYKQILEAAIEHTK